MAKRKVASSYTEQRRRAQQAKQTLLPAAIATAGQVGFGETAGYAKMRKKAKAK
ncbi:MAG TPA: hypothetical protein VMW24_16670 [Sedimentisphaerales bacterium]|nr:hypothetical protein [Sedimentisphaerales bacterium]